ncbi:MAG: tape measure protein [Pseudomonadota bacterium]
MNNIELGIRITADGKIAVVESGKVVTALKQIGSGAREAEQSSTALAAALSRIGHYGAAYFGIREVIRFAEALSDAALAADRLQNTLQFATGSAKAGAEALDYIRSTSNRLGVDMDSASRAFAKFAAAAQGTSLGMRDVKAVFESVSKASVVLGLSADETNGAMLALSQMMSKGTVMAEELRGQLGERIPGAFQIAARAMGVTTAELGKMLEAGQVVAADFLPKFAAEMEKTFGTAAGAAADSAIAKVNRLGSAWDQFKRDLGQASNMAGRPQWLIDGLNEAAAAMREANKEGKWWISILGILAAPSSFMAGATGPGKFSDDAIKRRAVDIQEEIARLQSKQYPGLSIAKQHDQARIAELQQELQGVFAQGRLKLPSKAELKGEAESQAERIRQDLEAAKHFSAAWSELYRSDVEKKRDAIEKLDALYVQESARFRGSREMQIKLAADYAEKRRQIDKKFEDKDKSESDGDRITARIGERTALLYAEAGAENKLTEAQRLTIDVMEQIASGNARLTDAEKIGITARLEAALAQDALNQAHERAVQSRDEATKAIVRASESSRMYVEQLQFENSLIGKNVLEAQILTEQRRIQVALEKEILAIGQSDKMDAAGKEAAIQAATEYADIAKRAAEDELAARDRVNRAWGTGARSAIQEYVRGTTDAAAQTKKVFTDAFQGAEDGLVQFVRRGKADFSDLADSVINDLIRIGIQRGVTGPAAQAGGDFLMQIGASLFGGPAAAKGAYFDSGVAAFARGGVVESPTLFRFAGGGAFRTGLMGEAGPEAIMPLKRDASGRLGVSGAATAVNVQVNVMEAPGTRARVEQRPDGAGGMNIDVIVEQLEGGMARRIAHGDGLAPVLERTYGLNRAAGAGR